jgi:hypothetical protein
VKAVLIVECINHGEVQTVAFWTRIMDLAGPGLGSAVMGEPCRRWGCWDITSGEMRPVPYKTNYRRANSKGSRGVMAEYILESGRRYHVRAPLSWKRTDEYDCEVADDGEIRRL